MKLNKFQEVLDDENILDRDCLFAEEVIRQCGENRYLSVVNDGKTGIKDLVEMVSAHFSLEV